MEATVNKFSDYRLYGQSGVNVLFARARYVTFIRFKMLSIPRYEIVQYHTMDDNC
jgi:hypothetical protein